MRQFFLIFILSFLSFSTVYAWHPSKPINVIIGFAPGSGNELSFRGISSIVEKNNPDVNFVIQNRPGAGGVVAMNEFIKKPNDGYTIYVPSNQGIFVTAEFFQKQAVKYSLTDFDYLLGLAKSPQVLIASHNSQVSNLEDFIKKLQNPNEQINFATGGGAHRLAFDYMIQKLGINRSRTTLVEYKGPAQAAQDVAGNHIDFSIIPAAVAAGYERAGKVKIIAVCGEKVIKGFENIPLINKYIPGMNVYAGWGIIIPKNTAKEIKDWYVKEFNKAITSKEVQTFFEDNYMFSDKSELDPTGFEQSMKQLRNHWIPVLENLSK